MFKRKLLLSSFALLMTSVSFADVTSKDWSYEKSRNSQICTAQTEAELDDISYLLKVTISKDVNQLSNVEVVASGSDIELLKIKALKGSTDRSIADATNFYIVDERRGEVSLKTPVWKAGQLIGDLISDSTLDLELVTDSAVDFKEVNFSLRGSSKVLKAMAKDCLGNSNFSKPYELAQILTAEEASYLTTLSDKSGEQLITPKLDSIQSDVLELSQEMFSNLDSAYPVHQELVIAQQNYRKNDKVVNSLNLRLDRIIVSIDNLSVEKSKRQQQNRSLLIEQGEVSDLVLEDSAVLPELEDSYKQAQRQLEVARQRTADTSREMDELEQNVDFYQSKLNQAERESQLSRKKLRDVSIELSQSERELRDLNNSTDINRLEESLRRNKRERRQLRADLDNLPSISQRLRRDTEYQDSLSKLSKIESRKNELEDNMRQVRSNIRNFNQKLEQLKSSMASDRQNLRNIDSDISNLKAKKQSNVTKINELDIKRKTAHAQMRKYLAQYKADCGGGHTDQNIDHCRNLLSKKKAQDKIINRSSDRANKLRTRNNEMDVEISAKKNQKNTLPGQISEKQMKISNLQTRVQDLKSSQQESRRKMDNLAQRESKMKSRVAQIESQVRREHQVSKREIERRMSQLGSNIQDLQRRIGSINSRVSQLENRISNLINEERSLDSELSQLDREISNLRIDLSSSVDRRDDFASSNRYKNASQALARAERKASASRKSYSEVSKRLSDNEEKLKEIDSSIAFNDRRIASIPAELEQSVATKDRIEAELPAAIGDKERSEEVYNSINDENTLNIERIVIGDKVILDLI